MEDEIKSVGLSTSPIKQKLDPKELTRLRQKRFREKTKEATKILKAPSLAEKIKLCWILSYPEFCNNLDDDKFIEVINTHISTVFSKPPVK
jgi:hypothetical protein